MTTWNNDNEATVNWSQDLGVDQVIYSGTPMGLLFLLTYPNTFTVTGAWDNLGEASVSWSNQSDVNTNWSNTSETTVTWT